MPRVTSLDGRVFEIEEELLEKSRVPEEKVKALSEIAPLPQAPPERELPPPPGSRPRGGKSPWVNVQRVEGKGYVIEVRPPRAPRAES